MSGQPFVVTVEDDDEIHVHLEPRGLIENVVTVCSESPALWREFRDAVDHAQSLRSGVGATDRVRQFWNNQLDRALTTLAEAPELQDALTAVLTSGVDGQARALSDALDDAEGDILGQQLRAQGVEDEPDRDGDLADLGERPAIAGGAA